MEKSKVQLVFEARKLLDLYTNRSFAAFLGCSLRTVQRYSHQGGLSNSLEYEKLIRAVAPRDAALAADLARVVGSDPSRFGIEPVQPAVPDGAELPARAARSADADAVVCAVADVLAQSPASVRPIVAAAFRRALELDVDLDGLARLLAPPEPETPTQP